MNHKQFARFTPGNSTGRKSRTGLMGRFASRAFPRSSSFKVSGKRVFTQKKLSVLRQNAAAATAEKGFTPKALWLGGIFTTDITPPIVGHRMNPRPKAAPM